MNIITSVTNDKIKFVKKLNLKKYRKKFGLYAIEGINILKDMPSTVDVNSFFVTETMVDSTKDIVNRFNSSKLFIVTDDVMKSIADTVSPSGLLAVIKIPNSVPDKSNALILDRVSDSGNIGTLIRTAVSADFKNIYLINCADVYAGKVVRSSMGGIFRANLICVTEDEALEIMKGYNSVAMDMSGVDIYGYQPKFPTAVVLGNESQGVSEMLLNSVDQIISLEMNNGMESLNVAVAGGISMYYIKSKIN